MHTPRRTAEPEDCIGLRFHVSQPLRRRAARGWFWHHAAVDLGDIFSEAEEEAQFNVFVADASASPSVQLFCPTILELKETL